MKLCTTCNGRGEVSAGITVSQGTGYPTEVIPNPKAKGSHGELWLLTVNPLVLLWSIAICGSCQGCGLHPSEMQKQASPQT